MIWQGPNRQRSGDHLHNRITIPDLRSLLWLGFFAAILVAWAIMFRMSMTMDLDLLGRPGAAGRAMAAMDPAMDMPMPMARFAPLAAMWAVMMAAMMLPTLVPTLRAYEDLITSANGSRAGWLGVVSGYFTVWAGFALMIAAAQLALLHAGLIDMLGTATTGWFAAGLLIGVGLYQFSRAKELCHGVCHSPAMYFLGHWRTGFGGGLRMGLGLGAFCVGCCWGFMALGFVGGVMSLAWMGLATLFMVIEKLPQIGQAVTRPLGVALILAGLASPWISL
jgi:predicted metal-binding membrane protein